MPRKVYQVLEEYKPSKHKEHLTPVQKTCIKLLKKGTQFEPKQIIIDNMELLSDEKARDRYHATEATVFGTLRIARGLGIIKEVNDKSISFIDFCELDSVSYFAEQLRGSKNKNIENKKISSTKKDYLYRLWHFNNWLHGKEFEFKIEKQLTDDTFKVSTQKIKLDSVEHLLTLFQQPHSNDSDYIKVIKRYLNDSVHNGSSAGYMNQKHASIISYFEKNECELHFKYDSMVKHQDYSEESEEATLSLQDLYNMLTTGKNTVMEKAVVLCKFHRGLDNSTFADRFNFQAFEQIAKYFGTEIYDSWDLDKCPIPITVTRIKTNYKHRGFLDRDAIEYVQRYLKVRYEQTSNQIRFGEPLFINKLGQPITIQWIGKLIPRLAKNSGIQKKIKNSELTIRNEKTSHELRDLLKSTLIVSECASYVADLAIGHRVTDSYEKMDKLYPDKSRLEFSKASMKLNIFSKVASSLSEDFNTISELKEKIEELDVKNTRLTKGARVILGETIHQQSAFIESMEKKMSEMANEIKKLQKQNNTYVEPKMTVTSKEHQVE